MTSMGINAIAMLTITIEPYLHACVIIKKSYQLTICI